MHPTTALESLVAMGFGEDESNAVRPPSPTFPALPRVLGFGRNEMNFLGRFVCVIGVCVLHADHFCGCVGASGCGVGMIRH